MAYLAVGGALVAVLASVYVAFALRLRRRTLRIIRRGSWKPRKPSGFFGVGGGWPKTCSLEDYFESLQLTGGKISLQALLAVVLERYGLTMALPVGMLRSQTRASDRPTHSWPSPLPASH